MPMASEAHAGTERSSYTAFARRLGAALVTSGLVHLRNLLLLPFLTKQLTVADFGAWSQVLAVTELLTSLALLSLNAAALRFLAGESDVAALRRGATTSLALVSVSSVGLAAATYTASSWLAVTFLHEPAQTDLFRIAAVLIPVTALEKLVIAFFHARLQMRCYSAFVVAEACGYVLLAIGLLQAGFGVEVILVGVAGMRLCLLLLGLAIVGHDTGYALGSGVTARTYLSYSLPLLLVAVFAWIAGVSDRYIVGFFLGAEAVGIYSVSYTLGMVCMVLFAPIFIVLNPTLVRLWEDGDRQAIHGYLRHCLRYGLAVSLPALVWLTLLAAPVVAAVSGPEYFADRSTVGLVGLGLLFLMISGMAETLVGLLHRTRYASAVYGVTATVNIVGNLFLIPLWGVRGAAAATCGAYLLQLLLFGRFVRRHGLGLPIDGPFVGKSLVATAVAMGPMGPMGAMEVHGPCQLLASAGVGAVVYGVLMLCMGAFTRGELSFWTRFAHGLRV